MFCSVARIRSATAVEQLLGRVLRMPYAKRRALPELNKAYAHIAEPVFTEAAKALVDKLVDMGFDDFEARENIENPQYELDSDGLFALRERPAPIFRQTFQASPEAIDSSPPRKRAKTFQFARQAKAQVEVAVTGYLAPAVEAAINNAIPATARGEFADRSAQVSRRGPSHTVSR